MLFHICFFFFFLTVAWPAAHFCYLVFKNILYSVIPYCIPKVYKSPYLNTFILDYELVLGVFNRYCWCVFHSRGFCICVCLGPGSLYSVKSLTIFLAFSKHFPQASLAFVNAYKSLCPHFQFLYYFNERLILMIFLVLL